MFVTVCANKYRLAQHIVYASRAARSRQGKPLGHRGERRPHVCHLRNLLLRASALVTSR
ncbi:MAG: hypothetical protein MZU97_24330 [Bacillus subtilis]|nr:hypothetical protein [Bacillus subtilis]